MAISWIGNAEGADANGADVTLTLPAMAQDDLVIASYGIADNDNVDENMAMVTTGYTEVADLFSNDVADSNLGVFYKFMGATPDTTAVVDGLGGVDAAVTAVCQVFRGVDLTTPLDVVSTTATGIDSFHPDPPSIDHLNPSGLWTVIAGTCSHTQGLQAFTNPTGYTTNAVDIGIDNAVGEADGTTGMGHNSAPADPEDPGVMTHSGTNSTNFSWCAVTMALRPAAAAGTTWPGWMPNKGGWW